MEKNNEEKIYGIYPGFLVNPEEADSFSELDLFESIDFLNAMIWRCRHDMADNRIDEIDLTEPQYSLEFLANKTRKFGVELPEPEAGKHLTATESYNAWYSFYYNHFHYTLTDEEWKAYQKARKNKEDVSEFMPEGCWKDLLEENQKARKK